MASIGVACPVCSATTSISVEDGEPKTGGGAWADAFVWEYTFEIGCKHVIPCVRMRGPNEPERVYLKDLEERG